MTMKFPVALWQDPQGAFTASVLDGARAAAMDVTPADALLQLKRYLTWRARKEGLVASDFGDLVIRDHRIRIRGKYKTKQSSFPVNQPVTLRITCIHGQRQDGSRHCVIPTLGIRLSYQPGDPVEDLVSEAVQQAIGEMTPQELSRELMPAAITLDAVHIREQAPSERDGDESRPVLASVAERLGHRSRGSRHSRALLRAAEVRQVAERLSQGKANLLLIGEDGVGKTTVLVEAIRQLQRTKPKSQSPTPDEIKKARVIARREYWLTSGARLIAGMKYLGQWEDRCEDVIAELGENGGVLCVEDLLELATAGGCDTASSVASFLIPYLQRGELRLVAEATVAELD